MRHLSMDELEAGLRTVRESPADGGELHLIVRRPARDAREVVADGVLDPRDGLVGDDWSRRRGKTPDGTPNPATQLTLINSRTIGLIAGDRGRWALAGDQLYVDLDLSAGNLPAGTRLSIGEAEIEVTDTPHTGCAKFAERFGRDALTFVSTAAGRELRLRGLYAKVVRAGTVRAGDRVRKT